MFGKKTIAPQVDIPNTVIGEGIILEAALLTGKESIRIDGTLYGNVDLNGSLILGETGIIEGKVRAKYIIAAGMIRGNIECDTIFHISSTARINGDITAKSLIVDEGGQLNGRYQIGESREMISAEPQPLLPNTESGSGSGSEEKSYLERSLEIVEDRSAYDEDYE